MYLSEWELQYQIENWKCYMFDLGLISLDRVTYHDVNVYLLFLSVQYFLYAY